MSGKLDQSLDEIMKDRKPSGAANGSRRRGTGRLPARKAATKSKAATTAVVAPAGGIQKKGGARAPAVTSKTAAAALANGSGESKIAVSNLPLDVDESLIKEYFIETVGPVKKVILNYGPDGRSRGTATVSFNKPTAAAEAAKADGTRVDNKPMRIEVLVGAKNVAKPAPLKSLQDRVSKPKNATKDKPKPAAKATTNGDANGAAKKGRGQKPARAGRPKAKTAEELDAEMQDYFGGGQSNGAAQPAASGETMDEVM